MSIEIKQAGEVDVLAFPKDLTVNNQEDLGRAVLDALKRNRSRFVLELSRARFVDSSAIGEICACFKRAREHGGTLKLVLRPGGKVDELFRLVSLDRILEIFGTEAAALRSFEV